MAAKKAAPVKPARKSKRASELAASKLNAGEQLVVMDRRRGSRRAANDDAAPAPEEPAAPLERRAKVQRRRQIDPTTCERDYSVEEVEFMNAMDEYKRKNGRMFPTCSEVLEVIRALGYVRLSPTGRAMLESEGLGPEIALPQQEESLTPEDFAF